MCQYVLQFLQVGKKILHPECRPFAHGNKLRGLIVGIAEGGQRLVFLRKVRKIFQHVQQFLAEMAQTVPIKDQIPVIGYITACGP